MVPTPDTCWPSTASPCTTPTTRATPPPIHCWNDVIIAEAYTYLGTPYRYGGSSHNGIGLLRLHHGGVRRVRHQPAPRRDQPVLYVPGRDLGRSARPATWCSSPPAAAVSATWASIWAADSSSTPARPAASSSAPCTRLLRPHVPVCRTAHRNVNTAASSWLPFFRKRQPKGWRFRFFPCTLYICIFIQLCGYRILAIYTTIFPLPPVYHVLLVQIYISCGFFYANSC